MITTLYWYKIIFDTGEWYAEGFEEYATEEEANAEFDRLTELYRNTPDGTQIYNKRDAENQNYEPYAIVRTVRIGMPAEMEDE